MSSTPIGILCEEAQTTICTFIYMMYTSEIPRAFKEEVHLLRTMYSRGAKSSPYSLSTVCTFKAFYNFPHD